MSEIDQAIADLRVRRDKRVEQIAGYEAEISDLRTALAAIDGEIRGLERAKELLGAPATEAAPRERHAVQRVIMNLFGGAVTHFTEAEIVAATNLPVASAHTFLLRAARSGKLFEQNGVYYKHKPTAEAAA
jgi:hypothetical protein